MAVTKKIAQATNIPELSKEAAELKKALDNMALNIQSISAAFKAVQNSRINMRLLRLMIKDICGVSYVDIDKVLNALSDLEKIFVKKP